MNLYIDIGNSNIVIGKGVDTVEETYRYTTDPNKSSDEYFAMLQHLFDGVEDVYIASVVPQVNAAFKTFLTRYYAITPTFIGPGVKTGVQIKTDNPKEVGADLVCGAAGAIALYGHTAIVVDMGTATTVSYIENQVLKGVAITLGIDSAKQCLVSRASKLLQFEFETPKDILGTNTIDALNAGLVFGHAFQIIGLVNNIRARYQAMDAPVIMTGGASRIVSSILPKEYHIDEHLVLKGLIAIRKRQINA